MRVGQRSLEGRAGAAHGAVHRGPAQEQAGGEERGHAQGDEDGVSRERFSLAAAAGSEGPRDGRRDAAAHAAG